MKCKKYSKEYYKMVRQYQHKLARIGRNCFPWDYGWSLDFLIEHLKFMRDYYTLNENVMAREDCEWQDGETFTRLEKINFILEAYDDWSDFKFQLDSKPEEERERYFQTRDVFFSLLSQYIESLWD